MIRKRTIKEVRRYDIFKLSIVLLLLVLILFMMLRENDSSTVATTENEAIISEAGETPDTDAIESDSVTEEAYPTDSDTTEQEDTASSSTGVVLLSPAQDAEMEAGPIIFSGSGEPDTIVRILADGSELGQTTVDANGNWYLEANLEAGEPIIEVQSIDSDGNVVDSTTPLAIEVAAAKPVVNEPDLVLNEMNLYAGSVELSGSGEPGHQVAIFVDGEEAGTVDVTEDGNWNLPLDVEDGSSTVSLQTLDENGNVINEAGPFEITIQETILPTVTLPEDDVFAGGTTLSGTGQPGTQVQLYANEQIIGVADVDGSGIFTITVDLAIGRYNIDVATLDQAGNALALIPALSLPVLALEGSEIISSDNDMPEFDPLSGLITWRGTADPKAQLALLVNVEIIAQTTADGDGNWTLQTDLDPGTYQVSIEQLDADGNVVSESDPVTIELDQRPPTLELPDYSVSDSGKPEDALEQSILLPVGEFDWTGQSDPAETVAIIVDGEVVGEATADADGNWVITTNLEPGDHEVQTGTVDTDGSISNQSAAVDLNVADMKLPTMETPQLDESGKGSISGTADPDAIVTVTANGKVVGIATPDENGSWTLNVEIGAGSYEMQVQILDQEGDVVLSSAKQTVEVGGVAEQTEEDDVIDVAAAQGGFSTLLDGLEAAGLSGRLSDVDEAFTLFAPTDDAFGSLPQEVVTAWGENPEAYKEIMSYLVLEGANTQEELAEAQVLTTLAGTNIGITTKDDNVLINSVLIEASFPAGSSIVHAINQVILPPLAYQVQPPIVDISGVSIFTGDYLTVVGTAEPGKTILLQVGGENFGELATVDDTGSWLVSDDITSGVHEILAYMLDENGLLMAISQQVNLPVQ